MSQTLYDEINIRDFQQRVMKTKLNEIIDEEKKRQSIFKFF